METIDMQKVLPTIGRIVHVVVKDGNGNLRVRPGIVVETFPGNAMNGTCNLNIHQDGTNDGGDPNSPVRWMPSVSHVEPIEGTLTEGTWHWPVIKSLLMDDGNVKAEGTQE